MGSAYEFERPMQFWHKRNLYLKEHYSHLDGVRFRPTGEPPQTVEGTTGPLVFTSSTRLHGLTCLVTDASGDAAVGNAIDELLNLRYSQEPTTETAEWGRHRVRQVMFGPIDHSRGEPRTPAELQTWDEAWKEYRRVLKSWLPDLRADTIEDEHGRTGLGRHGMVLGLHAAVGREPMLCQTPERRHSRLKTTVFGAMLEIPDGDEISAVADMLHLATRALPAPSQLTRSVVQPRCGHGQADLLLDGTLIEVKSGGSTRIQTLLTGDGIRQLLGYVLSVPPTLEKSGSVTRAGWYLARFGLLWDFPIEEIPSRLYGRPLPLDVAREAFRRGVPPAEVTGSRA
ncbi:hypothetical protein [Brachybacterium subflavum]|uniref:hypothetical protein n=1 Tax=Brachybacterium subflavum TaxID=2585206 RepID=UPI0012663A9D|nr:hypothetical protein [Brachybacterium subflavum]